MFCSKCGKKIKDNINYCSFCGVKISSTDRDNTQLNSNKNNNQENRTKQAVNHNKQKLEGFGGWLTLFGLGIFVSPIFIFFSLITDFKSYQGLDIFFNILIIISYIWLNYLMIKRKKVFKKWFFGIGTSQVILDTFIVLGANSQNYLYTPEELSNINTSAFRTLFYVIVWSLYLWNSERAKNTFIN